MAVDSAQIAPDAGTLAPAPPVSSPSTNGNTPAPAVPEAPAQPPAQEEELFPLDQEIARLDTERAEQAGLPAEEAQEETSETPETQPQQEAPAQEPALADTSVRLADMEQTVKSQKQELDYYKQQEAQRVAQAGQAQLDKQRDDEYARASQWYDKALAQIEVIEDPGQKAIVQQAFDQRAEAVKLALDTNHRERQLEAREQRAAQVGAEAVRRDALRYASTQTQTPEDVLVRIMPRTDNTSNPYLPVGKAYQMGVQDATRKLSANTRAEQQTDRIPAVGGVGGRTYATIQDAEAANVAGELSNEGLREQRRIHNEELPY